MKLPDRGERRNIVEQRFRALDGVELRTKDDGKTIVFTGYASVTEAPYEMNDWLGDYMETVRHGAFAKTLRESADVPFKLNHDGMTLARTKSGTMRLAEDDTGLHVEADLDPANSVVRDLQSAMERGDMDEMSFAFQVTRQEWSPDFMQRDISEVNLNKGDVSLVNYGANPHTAGLTGISARSLAEVVQEIRGSDALTADDLDLIRNALRATSPVRDPGTLSLYAARARLLDL